MDTNNKPIWAEWREIVSGDRTGGMGIYALGNVMTGRVLICATADLAKRLHDCRVHLSLGHHWNAGVQADLALYGSDSFKLFLIEQINVRPLLRIEKLRHVLQAKAEGKAYNIKSVWGERLPRRPTSIQWDRPTLLTRARLAAWRHCQFDPTRLSAISDDAWQRLLHRARTVFAEHSTSPQ